MRRRNQIYSTIVSLLPVIPPSTKGCHFFSTAKGYRKALDLPSFGTMVKET
jgi:hypothetical protein